MTGPAIGRGPDPALVDRLSALLGSHIDEEQRVIPLGHRDIGGNQSKVSFRASRACQFVRYHVQHSGQSQGSTRGLFTRGLGRHATLGLWTRGLGLPSGVSMAYDQGASVATGQVDCRSERQQEITITRDGTNRYCVYLIPEFLEVDGTFTKFDGVDSDDRMAYVDLGV